MFKKSKAAKSIDYSQHINVDFKVGLNDEQVKERVTAGLTNKIAKHVSKSYLKIILDNVVNFFNILLIIIAIFMMIAKIPYTSYAFLVILVINISIGLFQDIKARRLTDKLKVVSYPYVKVIRNREELTIPANELVLSDVIVLKAGDQIVADGTILSGMVEVNESIMTGESINVSKDRGQTIMSGTYVVSGKCYYRVDHVGKENYAEKLQTSAKLFKKPKSDILLALNKIFKIIAITVILLATIEIALYVYPMIVNHELPSSDDFACEVGAIAGSLVSMIPTGMYLLTSITLAVGAVRLANRKVLVQELYCIENLARANVLCLDKTGTITDGTMNVREIIPLVIDTKELRSIIHTLVVATGDTNVTANALLKAYDKAPVLDYFSAVPFNSERKFSAVMLKDGRSVIVGAREFIPHNDKKVDERCEKYEKQGLRVLVVAISKQVVSLDRKLDKCEIAGIIILEDHIKEDAIDTIQWFKDNDVKIVVISGDSPISVSSIAKKAGVENADKCISLDGMDIAEVKLVANSYTVFGRVNPEQKRALIEALKDAGNTVAMTGDGVNDILALKVADCSIAMGSGADAAKNVAHLVSMDSKFSSLPNVVSEGRRVINNLQRTCSLFLVKTAFAAFFTVIALIARTRYPFETNNMYIWELVTIGIGSLFLSLQPNEERLKSSFIKNIMTYSLPTAVMQVLLGFSFFIVYYINEDLMSYEAAKTLAVIAFSIGSYYVLFRICRPFDIYRGVLFISCVLIGSILFVIDRFSIFPNLGEHEGFFKLNYDNLNSSNWWILLIALLTAIPVYIGLEKLAKLAVKFLSKRKVKNYENF